MVCENFVGQASPMSMLYNAEQKSVYSTYIFQLKNIYGCAKINGRMTIRLPHCLYMNESILCLFPMRSSLRSHYYVLERFGSVTVPGIWMTGRDVVCTTPAHSAGTDFLEISPSSETDFTNAQVDGMKEWICFIFQKYINII